MTGARRSRRIVRCTPGEEEMAASEAVIEALARREPVPDPDDPAVRLLLALIDDVDQRRSSVSMTPST